MTGRRWSFHSVHRKLYKRLQLGRAALCVCVDIYVCVCTSLEIFMGTKNWNFTILVGTKGHFEDKSACPREFEGIFESQNVVLVSGLQLGYR